MKIPEEPVRPARLEMVPMIDCMFLILVSFTYSFLSMTNNAGIPVTLPKAVHAVYQMDSVCTVCIEKGGAIFLDGNPVGLEELGPLVARSYVPDETSVTIQADAQTPHHTVVTVLDALRKSGIHKVSLGTDQGTRSP